MNQGDEESSKQFNPNVIKQPSKATNNKSQCTLIKKKREVDKKRQQRELDDASITQQKEKHGDFDEFGAPDSKNEYDEDTKSLNEGDE